VGERKQVLAEYQTKRANEAKEQKRQEVQKAKVGFRKLLMERLPEMSVASHARFHDMREKLAKDDRFFAIEEEGTREELFYDFVEEMRKREERIQMAKRKSAKDGFIKFLKEKEEQGALSFSSTWASFRAGLAPDDMKDKRFIVSETMTDLDRQVFFADHVTELQAVEDEKRRRIRDARRRAEKSQRDTYREFLCNQVKDGEINIATRWRSVEDTIENDASYLAVFTQDNDAPREIFEDFLDDLRDGYRRDKPFLSRLIYSSSRGGVKVQKDSTYEHFCQDLVAAAVTAGGSDMTGDCKRMLSREPVSSALLFFHELHQRAKNDSPSGNGFAGRRKVDESEDEGEIVEDGEVDEGEGTKRPRP